jgi:hypothetical protein
MGDVARTYAVSYLSEISKKTPGWMLMAAGRWLFVHQYLRTYFKSSPYKRAEMDAWLMPVAAARLAEEIPEAEGPLLRAVREGLEKL